MLNMSIYFGNRTLLFRKMLDDVLVLSTFLIGASKIDYYIVFFVIANHKSVILTLIM